MSFYQRKCERQSTLLEWYAKVHLQLKKNALYLNSEVTKLRISALAYRRAIERQEHCIEYMLSDLSPDEIEEVVRRFSLYGKRMRGWKKGKYSE